MKKQQTTYHYECSLQRFSSRCRLTANFLPKVAFNGFISEFPCSFTAKAQVPNSVIVIQIMNFYLSNENENYQEISAIYNYLS